MESLNKLGIYTIDDLMNYGLHNFKSTLLDHWQNILFYDPTIKSNSNRLLNYSNPLYWQNLLTRNTKTAFNKHRSQLNDFILNHSENIKGQLTEIMSEKIDLITSKGAQIDTLYIGSIHTPQPIEIIAENEKFCRVTGFNISMQKDNSFLLSHTGLKYYFRTDKKVFEEVKRKYLSPIHNKKDIKTQIQEIAHNIRNVRNNSKLRQQRIDKELKYQYSIF